MQKGNAFKGLNIIHKALMAGQLLFAAASFYLIYSKAVLPIETDLDKVLQVAALIMAAGGIFGGMNIFKKKLVQLRDMQTAAKEKFDLYRSACIIQWALMEGPSIFCVICFILTGNYAFLALMLVVLFLFALMAPSKSKLMLQLQISEAELDDL